MDSKTVKSPFWMRPLQFEGTRMQGNVLLMCKLTVLLLIAHHFFTKTRDPFIPFFEVLDVFNSVPGLFENTLRVVFLVFTITLMFNIWVRSSAVILGTTVILSLVASKPHFNNHTFVIGCALFLAGLTDKKRPPLLLVYQLALIYIGASLNKICDADWWSGDFMHTWLFEARQNPFYITVSSWFPERYFAKFLSWVAMSTELLIGITLLIKKYRVKSVWFIIIFHFLLFTITSFRFGHFIESLAFILIAMIVWPKPPLKIYLQPGKMNLYQKLLKLIDWDKKIVWHRNKLEKGNWLRLESSVGTITNDQALKDSILYMPAFFLILFGIDVIIYLIFYNQRQALFIVNLIQYWSLIIFFLPISWSKIFRK